MKIKDHFVFIISHILNHQENYKRKSVRKKVLNNFELNLNQECKEKTWILFVFENLFRDH